MTCDDLRLGGTLASSGLTGGTSINSTALAVSDWAGLLGVPGVNLSALEVNGRPGAFFAGDGHGGPRVFSLPLTVTRWGPSGVGSLVETSENRQLSANTDTFLDLASEANYLEVDMPDGTSRFLYVRNLDPAYTTRATRFRDIRIPFVSDWPYWREGGQENTQVINGADVMVFGGNKPVYDAVLAFAGDGTLSHDDEGWSIEVTGSAAAVTVDLGDRTVVESGAPATNRIRRDSRDWGWFPVGTNNVTSDVAVTVTWRDQYV